MKPAKARAIYKEEPTDRVWRLLITNYIYRYIIAKQISFNLIFAAISKYTACAADETKLRLSLSAKRRPNPSLVLGDLGCDFTCSPVKLVEKIRAPFQASSGNSDSVNWPGYKAAVDCDGPREHSFHHKTVFSRKSSLFYNESNLYQTFLGRRKQLRHQRSSGLFHLAWGLWRSWRMLKERPWNAKGFQ